MNLRLLIPSVLLLSLASFVHGEEICGSGESAGPVHAAASFIVPVATVGCDRFIADARELDDPRRGVQQSLMEIPSRAELLRQISVYEAIAKKAQVGANDDAIAKIYTALASLYEDVAMYSQSAEALDHSIKLLRRNPESSDELATNVNFLGMLHAEMGKMHEAELEEMEALRLREQSGDSLEIARSWNSLSVLYFRERKYMTSRDLAQRALDEFSRNRGADVVDRLSSRMNLSLALCYMKECQLAVPVLKDAVAVAKIAFKANDFPVGEAEFLLGFAYWKSGDVAGAKEYMEAGTSMMKEQLGWGHPAYLNALSQYARFLRENHRVEDAEAVERQIRQAEAVVDVHSIQTRDTDSLRGLH
jgi:tetratricopeptide (TPR) repeat protein